MKKESKLKLNREVEDGLWEVYRKSLASLYNGGDNAGVLNVAKECLIVLSSFELTGKGVVTNGDTMNEESPAGSSVEDDLLCATRNIVGCGLLDILLPILVNAYKEDITSADEIAEVLHTIKALV